MKTLFLSKVAAELGLEGVTVVRGRLETLLSESGYLRAFDGFTARATTALAPTLLLAGKVIRPNGYAFLWKGSRRDQELDDDRWRRFWELEALVGIGDGKSSVCIFIRNNVL